ncbi:MAG TPA: radical SAM family heme chaperone HemW [Gemmatimonadaceae bacterium]|nr:radical SAM family heme chaperone HemW [Gemmatimonadaceae bacterium]
MLSFTVPPRHVYVHVPFCGRRCSYCDFSIAVRRTVPVREYLAALAAELELRDDHIRRWSVDTLYVGGGTPSRLGADGVAELLDLLRGRFTLDEAAEITIEANPEDVTIPAVRHWRTAGVTRLSIGAQSFEDGVLAWMHRTHTAAQITSAVEAARAGGIANFSLDLIFALPEALERNWRDDLQSALALDPPHVSLYGLTVEPATPLHRWRERGMVHEAPDERYEAEFVRAHDLLVAAGYEHYEVSNYARPGWRSRHNASYWRRVPYLGLGPSAHSFDGTRRRWNLAAYAGWERAVSGGRDPLAGEEVLTGEDHRMEECYLGLRTDAGIALTDDIAARVQLWIDAGWAWRDGARLKLTAAGWLRLDALSVDLTHTSSCC